MNLNNKNMNYNQYFEFYITRYLFPPSSLTLKAKLYKTFYQYQGSPLTPNLLQRLTGINKFKSLIKLKQIVKNINKTINNQEVETQNTLTHNYSLYYEIVQHFILSPMGLQILKHQSKILKNNRNLFESLFQDIQTLILQRIYFPIDIQNFGITTSGLIKLYIPANFILEECVFTENHEMEMRTSMNATFQFITRNMQNLIVEKEPLDIELIRQKIKKQIVGKVQPASKNIQSQIFTFNEKPESLEALEDGHSHNEELEKTVKIRKSSQKIEFIPVMEFNLLNHSLTKDPQIYHIRSKTSRQWTSKENDRSFTKKSGELKKKQSKNSSGKNQANPQKQNEYLKEKMKEYEEKLQFLNNTVRQMKEELVTMGKKDTNTNESKDQPQRNMKKYSQSPKKPSQHRQKEKETKQRAKTHEGTSRANESRQESISIMVEKLETSRLQIKRFMQDDTLLRKSYLLEERDQEEDRSQQEDIDLNQEQVLNQQIQSLITGGGAAYHNESFSNKFKKAQPIAPNHQVKPINSFSKKEFKFTSPQKIRKLTMPQQNSHLQQNHIFQNERSKFINPFPSDLKPLNAGSNENQTQNKQTQQFIRLPNFPKKNSIDIGQTLKIDSNDLENNEKKDFVDLVKSPKKDSIDLGSRKRFNSFDYQSSLGKYSPPGNNPFRQYGNFRIQYVIDEEGPQKGESPQKKQKVGGHIQIHKDPSVKPYRIIKSPGKKQQFFYPVVQIRQPFRYSCVAVPKVQGEDYEYFAIPQNMYDPTEYDSIDTFQMELGYGKQHEMPSIISKNAFRHTLLPSTFVGVSRTDERRHKKSTQQKQTTQLKDGQSIATPRLNQFFQSAGGKPFIKYIQAHISEQNQQNRNNDPTLQSKNFLELPNIKEATQAFHELQMEADALSNKDKDQPKLVRNQSGQLGPSSKLKQALMIARHKINLSYNQQDLTSKLSKSAKDVSKLIREQIIPQKNFVEDLKKLLNRENRLNKKAIDKEKIHAVLNKSKAIISKYKNISTKKE